MDDSDLLFSGVPALDGSLLFGDAGEDGSGAKPGIPYVPDPALLFDHAPAVDGALEFWLEGQTDGDETVPGVPYEPNAALVFQYASATDGELLFDLEPGTPGGSADEVPVTVAFALPGPTVAVRVALSTPVRVTCVMPGPRVAVVVRYASNTERPLVARAVARWQDATHDTHAGVAEHWQDANRLPVGKGARWQDARAQPEATGIRWRDAKRFGRDGVAVRFQDGQRLQVGARYAWQDAQRFKVDAAVRYQDGLPVRRGVLARFQDGIRNRGQAYKTSYQDAARLAPLVFRVPSSHGRLVEGGWAVRYQDARQPNPGLTVFPETPEPPFDPCYTPDPALLFQYPAADFANGEIVFFCDNHSDPVEPGETVVVPIRRIYTVINTATLRRVDDGTLIVAQAMSLTIDVESWTWSFTARTPGTSLALLQPTAGKPVEVEATINGVAYRAIVEGIRRDRTYAHAELSITGRGKAALLDAPYSPVMTFGAADELNLQQLANRVLTINGVPLGWDIDAGWRPDNWQIPGGTFSHQGTYISALTTIATAAGAYLQPHPTAQALNVLKRYPAKPWEWNTLTPDYELPANVVQQEGIEWTDKPNYNRVFVRGASGGVLWDAKREGTAGDIEASMIVDPLMTNVVGAQQRALPALADVGRQAVVTLRLPVLAETGIIPPGKFVRYVDGGVTRVGLVRSTAADVERSRDRGLQIWQTIGVETHV